MKRNKSFISLSLALGIGFSMFAFADEANAAKNMHRLYNPNSGEHFYTADTNEKNNILKHGWRYEGIAWTAPDAGDNVYRLYNPNSGEHHYTMGLSEKNHLVKVGWRYEGVGWKSDTYKGQALYRLYNPNGGAGSHHYTKDKNERSHLLKVGWRNENIGWWGMNPNQKFNVTIVHKGSDGKELNKQTVAVTRETNYKATSKSFSGYTLKGSSSQTVKADKAKTITFNYTKNAVQKYNVTVVHKGNDGKELKKTTTAIEKGKQYTASAGSFNGYTLSGAKTQTVTINGNKTITFNYTKNTAPAVQKFKVIVVHKGSDGKVLETEKAVDVEKGKQHTAKAKTYTGYYGSKTPTQTITVNADSTITFTYAKKETANKTMLQKLYDDVKATPKGNYTDASWNTFQTALTTTKNVLLNSTWQQEIDDTWWKLNNAYKGLVENTTPIQKFNVTVVHKGNDGVTLQIDPAVSVEKGKQYTAQAKTFSGYTLQGSNTQTITVNANATITFNYTKNVVEEDLNAIASNVSNSALTYVNKYRKSYSNVLINLESNSMIQRGLNIRAQEIATLYEHARPDGSKWDSAIYGSGYGGSVINENIGRYQNVPLDWIKTQGAEQLVNMWINSSGHASNMLYSQANEGAVGVHITKNSNGTYNLYFVFSACQDSNKPISGHKVNITHKFVTGEFIGTDVKQVLEDKFTPTPRTVAVVNGKIVQIEVVNLPTVDLTNAGELTEVTVTYRLK